MTGADYRRLQEECFERFGDAPTVCTPWEPEPDDPDFMWMVEQGLVRPRAGA